MLLHLLNLAQTTPPADTSGTIITGFVVAVIGAVGAAIANVAGKKSGRAETLKIDPQPLMVKLEEKFVTRDDFREFKSDTRTSLATIEGLFRQTMTKIEERDRATMDKMDERDERLSAKIAAAVEKGVDGRVAIWNDIKADKERVNTRLGELGQRIAKTEAETNIGRVLERGIEALTQKKTTRG
jgi:hypothetical protein